MQFTVIDFHVYILLNLTTRYSYHLFLLHMQSEQLSSNVHYE